MKNLFSINESERERILGMHEYATRKQYLKESEELDEIDWGKVGTATAAGAAGGAAFAGVGAIPGAIIGGAANLIYQAFSGPGSKDAAQKITQGCNAKGVGETTMDDSAIDGVVDQLWNAMEGLGTDEAAIGKAFGSLQTIPDLCAVVKRYAENHPGYTLFNDLDGDIDDDSEWNKYVYQPMIKSYRRTQQIIKQAQQQQTNPDQSTKGGDVATNAQKCGWGNDVEGYKNSGWKCPKPGSKMQSGGGTGTSLAPRIKSVQKQVGVTESGTMDQATIDAIYNKLKSTPTGPATSTNVVGGEA
jgi:hypothetical protein